MPIFQGDQIETGANGAVGITFADESTFSLADNGQMIIDEMVYDPGTQSGKSAFSVAEGVFTFVSGQIAKTSVDAMIITTPVATIGVRGTAGGGKAAPEGSPNTFSLFPDPGGNVGEMVVTTLGGSQTLNTPNQTTQISSAYVPPSIPVVLPASAMARFYANARAVAPPPPTGPGATDQGAAAGGPTEGGPTEGGPTEAEVAEAEAAAAAAAAAAEAAAAEAAVLAAEAEAAAAAAEAEALAAAAEGEAAELAAAEAASLAAEAETAAAAAEAQAVEAAAAEATLAEAVVAAEASAQVIAAASAQAIAAGPGGPAGPGGVSAPAAAIAAGEQAFEQALAEGGSLEDAMAAAVSGATEAGLNAFLSINPDHFGTTANDVMDNIVNSVLLNVTGDIDPLSAGTGAGSGFSQFSDTMFFESSLAVIEDDPHDVANDVFGDFFGDAFGGEGEDFFDLFFDDPFGNYEDDFFEGDDFSFVDDFFFEEDIFSLEPVFDFLDEGEFIDDEFTSEPVITQSSFSEILIGSAGSDILDGTAENTNFYFSYNDIGGDDTITDAGGTNQIAFDGLTDTVIKFTINGSVATTGVVNIWGGAGVAGYSTGTGTVGTSDATYDLSDTGTYGTGTTGTRPAPDSTITFSNISQYLFADTSIAALSGGFSTHTEEDLTATPTEADSGDVIVMPALEINDIGYVIAGGSGADTFNLDDGITAADGTSFDGMIVFGKGGGDTFNITTQTDGLLIGGITVTDNSSPNSAGIPTADLNVFDYTSLKDASDFAQLSVDNSNGFTANIFSFFDTFDNKFETTATVTYTESSTTTLNNILWDVGSFIGSRARDSISLFGAKLNTLDGGDGNDSIIVDATTRILNLNNVGGTDTVISNGNMNLSGTAVASGISLRIDADGSAGTSGSTFTLTVDNSTSFSAGTTIDTGSGNSQHLHIASANGMNLVGVTSIFGSSGNFAATSGRNAILIDSDDDGTDDDADAVTLSVDSNTVLTGLELRAKDGVTTGDEIISSTGNLDLTNSLLSGISTLVIDSGNAGTSTLTIGVNTDLDTSASSDVIIIQGTGNNDIIQLANNVTSFDFSGVTLTDIVDIKAGTGGDTIIGTSSADTITGNTGNDIITGGGGTDMLNGGTGADTFFYTGGASVATATTEGGDLITGFATTSDEINLTGFGQGYVTGDVVDGAGATLGIASGAILFFIGGALGTVDQGFANTATEVVSLLAEATSGNGNTGMTNFEFIMVTAAQTGATAGGTNVWLVKDESGDGVIDTSEIALILNFTDIHNGSTTLAATDFV